MILPCYKHVNQGNKIDIKGIPVDIYSFKSKIINQQYIVEILNFEYDILVLQFYLKTHRNSDKRFSLLIPVRKGRRNNNRHVFLLLNTLVNIAKELIKKNPNASLGFMGAPTIKEQQKDYNNLNINPDNTIKNTKRHRVYSLYVKRYFSPELFTHIEYENSSCYLLRNNKNTLLDKDTSDLYLNELIEVKNTH